MTVRRSQDPSAQEHDENASSAAEHWTPKRREAAIPASRERALPTESSTAEEDVEDDLGSGSSGSGTREGRCGDGVAGQALDRCTQK